MKQREIETHRGLIEAAFENRHEINPENAGQDLVAAIEASLAGLEHGELRVAEPGAGGWHVNEWLKKAVLLYFRIRHNEVIDGGATRYFDKVPLRFGPGSNDDVRECGARIVPPATVRRGAFIGHDAVFVADQPIARDGGRIEFDLYLDVLGDRHQRSA